MAPFPRWADAKNLLTKLGHDPPWLPRGPVGKKFTMVFADGCPCQQDLCERFCRRSKKQKVVRRSRMTVMVLTMTMVVVVVVDTTFTTTTFKII